MIELELIQAFLVKYKVINIIGLFVYIKYFQSEHLIMHCNCSETIILNRN